MKRKNTSHCMCHLTSASGSCECPKSPVAFKKAEAVEAAVVVVEPPKRRTALERMKARQNDISTALGKFHKEFSWNSALPFTDVFEAVVNLDMECLEVLDSNYTLKRIDIIVTSAIASLMLVSEESTTGMVDPSSKLLAYWKDGLRCNVRELAEKAKVRDCFELYESLLTFLTFRQLCKTAKEILESRKKHQSTIQRLSLKAK